MLAEAWVRSGGPPPLILKKRIAHKGIWAEPKLLAEVEYRAKSRKER
ncbi:hypothetical protein ABIF63_001395 [Bradyrhizobium japonicum]|uniref:DNA ligase (ATP) n=1 Tax=Bradyrhizobium japonicum TaxID=375 RepID=A0ABV2RK26_BRAJP